LRPSHLIAPYVAPSGFFLFGSLQGESVRRTFEIEEELFGEVGELLNGPSSEPIISVFQGLVKRLEPVISLDYEYVS
jgi:hypothetical protein